jgi:hypothetical protein
MKTKSASTSTNRGLYLFVRKLTDSSKKRRANGTPDYITGSFRDAMVDLHRLWYETEEEWSQFLKKVRGRRQAEISEKLLDVAVAIFQVAVATYRGPLSYEASLSTANLRHLIENSSCPECTSQGDVIAILPHPSKPQWKLSCPECGHSWHTGEDEDSLSPLSDSDEQG